MILSVKASPRPTKRFRAEWMDKKGKKRYTDFGSPRGFTYIDGASETVRENYWKRHLANPGERANVVALKPSPSLFSLYLTWGNSREMSRNIDRLNGLMRSSE